MDFIFDDNDLDSFVLSNIKNDKEEKKKKKEKKKRETKYKEEYTFDTVEFYKSIRKLKLDAIMNVETDDSRFLYHNMWEPLTGEVLEKDPYGPLCFDPVYLIYNYYNQRLNNLWVKESDEHGGYYSGYYDSGVGAGEDCLIMSRGYHPEKYLFRLPIVDCYLTEGHNFQFITMGPKLTFEQIKDINEKVDKQKFIKLFGKVVPFNKYHYNMIPDLTLMKTCYDLAIKEKIEGISDVKSIIIKILFIINKYETIYKDPIPSMVTSKSLFRTIYDNLFFLIKINDLSLYKDKTTWLCCDENTIDNKILQIAESQWIFARENKNNKNNKQVMNCEGTINDFYKNVIHLSKSIPKDNDDELEKQFLNIINRRAVDMLVYM